MKAHIYFCIVMLSLGCSKKDNMGWPYAYNEDTGECVISVGPIIKSSGSLDYLESSLYLIDLSKREGRRSIQEIYNSRRATFVCWRPMCQELYIFKNIYGFDKVACEVYLVDLGDGNYTAKRIALYEGFKILNARWNRSGSLIVFTMMTMTVLLEQNKNVYEYESIWLLGYSFDKCKTMQASEIPCHTNKIVWVSDNVFHITNEGQVLEIEANEIANNVFVKEIINSSKIDNGSAWLVGCMNGKVAYRIEGDYYLGKELLYSADEFVYGGIAKKDTMLLLLDCNRRGLVLDGKGKIKNRFTIEEEEPCKILGLSVNKNILFLLKGNREIIAWDYVQNTGSVLFAI